nr:carboxylic ester hydrolase [uncultured bacterium]
MLISDTVMMLCLLGFCLGWIAIDRVGQVDKRIPSWLWLLAIGAFVAAAIGVAQGRWQAAVGGSVALLMLLCLILRSRRTRAAKRRPWFTTLLFLLGSAIAYVPLYVLPVFDIPEPTGPHFIGVRTFELTDSDRLGVLDAASDQPRRMLVRAWYPAERTGKSPMPYTTAAEQRVTFAGLATQIGMPSFFFSHLPLVRTNGYENVPVISSETPLPVVIFGHGYGSYLAQNTVLMEELASHGYLVISISHPYDAAPIKFSDGSVIETSNEPSQEALDDQGRPIIRKGQKELFVGETYDDRHQGLIDYQDELKSIDSRMLRSAAAWLDDRMFVTEALAAGKVPSAVADVIAKGDFSRIAHVGMSFGGSTSAGAAYEDPRCVAAVNLDGGDYYFKSINQDIPVPLLMLHSDWRVFADIFGDGRPADLTFAFNDFSYERHAQAGQREDVYRLRVDNVQHIGISDYPLMLRQPLSGLLVGSIDPDAMMRIINDFVRGFLDRHLRELNNGFPETEFATHANDVVRHDATAVRHWWAAKTPIEAATLEQLLADTLGTESKP